MVTISVANSFSRVSGLSKQQETILRAELSYLPGGQSASYYSAYPVKRKSLLDKKGEFPTGLLTRVEAFLGVKGVTLGQPPAKRLKFTLSLPYEPYQAQSEAAIAALLNGRGTIVQPTGTGKSVTAALIIEALQVRTLIVVPTLELKSQLQNDLASKFGSLKNITILNVDSPKLKTATNYDCLIIDEAHHSASATYQKLNRSAWQGIRYRFYLTATPFRNDEEEQLLFEALAGQVIFRLSYKDSVANKYIVPVESYYLALPKEETSGHTYAQVYGERVVRNDARNKLIAQFAASLYASNQSTLVLVREIDHGERLSELTGFPFVNGRDEESREYIHIFNRGEIKVLIGTEGVIGEGIDTRPAEWVIIAGLGKAKSALMQKIGRTVRNYPGKESGKVVLFKDPSHKWMLKHFREQCKIIRQEYGCEPIELSIGDL